MTSNEVQQLASAVVDEYTRAQDLTSEHPSSTLEVVPPDESPFQSGVPVTVDFRDAGPVVSAYFPPLPEEYGGDDPPSNEEIAEADRNGEFGELSIPLFDGVRKEEHLDLLGDVPYSDEFLATDEEPSAADALASVDCYRPLAEFFRAIQDPVLTIYGLEEFSARPVPEGCVVEAYFRPAQHI